MKVYLICISAADNGGVLRVAGNLCKAYQIMREERDKLVEDWKQMIDFIKNENEKDHNGIQTYEKMIQNLSGDDFETWNNYPHDTLVLKEFEVEE